MKYRFLHIVVCVLLAMPVAAQTVIDLKKGGKVHGKSLSEMEHPSLDEERLKRDSLKYNDCLTRAFNALSVDSLDEAEEAFRKALKLRPGAAGSEIVRFNIAQIEVAQGRPAQAVRTLTEALKTAPDYHEARRLRAIVQSELLHYSEVLSDCEALLLAESAEVKRADILFLRASAYMGLRRFMNARTDLEEVLRMDVQNENAALLLALTYDGEGRAKEAIDRINILLQAKPDYLEGYLARADIERRTGALLAARADFDRAIELNPGRAQSYAARAEVLLALGHKHAAQQDIDRAVQLGMPRSALRFPSAK